MTVATVDPKDVIPKKVIVVGGGSGIGQGVAREVLRRGGRVAIVGRSKQKLDAAVADLGAGSDRLEAHVADVTREPEVERLFDTVGAFGHLVTTVADVTYQPVRELDVDAVRRTLDSKLLSSLLLAKHAAGRMEAGGSLTLTSGIAAHRPAVRGAVVAAVNGALEALARALAIELAPLRVNAVSPGWVDTPIWERIAGAAKQERLEAMALRLPVGRVGQPDDIAQAVCFLMENGFTTGSVLHVDGGHRLV
ncbi:SDR family oxidoreductase [Corallococcus carmarthensis]|uniref:SDR family oxidoreductase n=1 Tax=Corallococcus carmarthensis TaxID=2316728 RepID=A0A3A8K5H3_9BACT|nr:SDR family oxidoreductase [Corallococcus carmarthensis]NOK22130.1 SDR family oxidoreductase [Corallococcus carmarthensis]RKG97691.1 SDR family oxidoreductase [Corallococcus carmarthensis]